jgi:hypothetical protein
VTKPPPEAGGGSRPGQDENVGILSSRATTPAQARPACHRCGAEPQPDDAIIIGRDHDRRRLAVRLACPDRLERLEVVRIGLRQNLSRLALLRVVSELEDARRACSRARLLWRSVPYAETEPRRQALMAIPEARAVPLQRRRRAPWP